MIPSFLSRLFSQAIRKGYWFCERCRRVHSVGVENDVDRCPHCKKQSTSRWHPAILTT